MSKFKQILMELAGTALNIPDGELKALIDKAEDDIKVEDVTKALKDKYRENINAFGKNQKDEGFKAAERSTSKKFEELLKTTFGISSDKQGEDLFSEVAESIKKTPGKGNTSDDDIKKSDVFQKMERLYKDQLKSATEEAEKKINDLQKDYARKEARSVARKMTSAWLDEEGYHFDDDPVLAANKKEDFLSKLDGYDYEIKDNLPIPLKDGKIIENEYGHTVGLRDLVNGLASKLYAKKVTDKRQSPHGQGSPPNKDGQKNYTGVLPKSANDYDQLMSDPAVSLEDKLSITDYWEKASA